MTPRALRNKEFLRRGDNLNRAGVQRARVLKASAVAEQYHQRRRKGRLSVLLDIHGAVYALTDASPPSGQGFYRLGVRLP
jgi:hypothetical protein